MLSSNCFKDNAHSLLYLALWVRVWVTHLLCLIEVAEKTEHSGLENKVNIKLEEQKSASASVCLLTFLIHFHCFTDIKQSAVNLFSCLTNISYVHYERIVALTLFTLYIEDPRPHTVS